MTWQDDTFDLDRFVRETLAEDLGQGLPGGGRDVTSESIIPADARFAGAMDTRDQIFVAGLPIAAAFGSFAAYSAALLVDAAATTSIFSNLDSWNARLR